MNNIKTFKELSESLSDMGKFELAKKKYPKQCKAIEKEKGSEWIKDQIVGIDCDDADDVMGAIIYYHYLESEDGKREWAEGDESEEKVDRITDAIYFTYVRRNEEEISFTKDEYEGRLSAEINDAVFNGVF